MGQSAQQVSFIEFNKICKRGDRGIEEGDALREKPNGKMNVRFLEA